MAMARKPSPVAASAICSTFPAPPSGVEGLVALKNAPALKYRSDPKPATWWLPNAVETAQCRPAKHRITPELSSKRIASSPSGPKMPSIVSAAPRGSRRAPARHGIHRARRTPRAIAGSRLTRRAREEEHDEELGEQERQPDQGDRSNKRTHRGQGCPVHVEEPWSTGRLGAG